MENFAIQGKRIIVTGGSRGIGAANVRNVVKNGAKVAIFDVLDQPGTNQRLGISKEQERTPTESSSSSATASTHLGETGNEWAMTPRQSQAGTTAGAQVDNVQPNTLGSQCRRPSLQLEWLQKQRHNNATGDRSPFLRTTQGEIGRWNIQAKLLEVQRMRTMVPQYMTQVNPRIPCLNGAQIDRGIEMLLSGTGSLEGQSQMETLVDLAMALIQVMTDEADDEAHQSAPPGWREFSHAKARIYSATWNSVPNLRTIQCLEVKAMYLLYTGKEDMSYDTMNLVVRLVSRLGLNSEEKWDLCSPFEIHMRQRIVSIILRLEKHIADCCRLLYILRPSDVEVPLPGHVDDHRLQVNLDQLPAEDPDALGYHIFYSYSYVNLLMETWSYLMGVGKHAQADAATVAVIDGRIESLRREVPSHLQWCPEFPVGTVAENQGRFWTRESVVLHLLLNHIRLVARQPWVEGSGDAYPEIAAQAVPIAINTISSIHFYYQTDLPDLVERDSSVRYLIEALQEGESLLAGSLDDCLEWYDLLALDSDLQSLNPSSGGNLQETNPVATGLGPSCYVHTENWLMQQG
ncbi:hypothetical protein BDW75DRAFT_243426 [Aspergillus navahoensis]